MVNMKRLGSLVGMGALAFSAACSTDLTVPNQNNPDVKRALASPQDVQKLATSSVNSWYLTSTYYLPLNMFSVTADVLTANFGNFGMRFNNLQPRIAYTNSSAADDGLVSYDPWTGNYQVLGAANDVLRALATGLSLGSADDTEMFKELAQFSQAAALTNLALTFDKAFIVDEALDPAKEKPELQPYTAVTAAALTRWDALIAASAGKSFEYESTVLPMQGGALTSAKLNRIANTMAGLLTAYSARNAAERDKVDWQKVLAYTNKGIGTGTAGAPFDFTVIGDNDQWYSYFLLYADYPSWMRVDMRVIHLMDPSQPAEFNGTIPPAAVGDKRLETDIKFLGKVIGDPSRGIYMQSPYYHKRYEYHSWQSDTYATGPAPYILAAESDLLRAEALVRTNGSLAEAATLINKTRVTRGGLPPATATDSKATLLDDIMYERDVELIATNGWELFRNRMEDRLRAGTVRHLPVPAKELEIQGMPIYTYGGIGNEM
jgi:starch-binding outer membrane protein, SusD/RagB family